MKTLTRIGLLMAVGLWTSAIPAAFAFDCPNMHKTVMAYYDKTTGAAGADQAMLVQGKHKDAIKGMANALNTINDARP